jgi:AraC family transcriptional regulator
VTSFAPITLGVALRSIETPSFRFTETSHDAATRLPAHAHERPALSFVLDGHREHRCGRRAFDCVPGSMMIVPAGCMHTSAFGRRPSRGVMVEALDTSRLPAALFDEPRMRRGERAAAAAAIARELQQSDDVSPLALESVALEVLVAEHRAGNASAGAGVPPRWLRDVRDLLAASFQAPPGLAALAAAGRVHPAHLARQFRHYFGRSAGEFVRELRLQRAAALLDDGQLAISEIASACGFADQSHLTRAFRRAFGVTPARWRNARSTATPRVLYGGPDAA